MARGNYPSDKQDQFMVRFPDGLRDIIKEAADRNDRSMNAEIIRILEMYYDEKNLILPLGLHQRVATIAASKGRSVREEVVATLSEAYPKPAVTVSDLVRMLEELSSDDEGTQSKQVLERLKNKIESGELDPSFAIGFNFKEPD